MPRKRGKTQTYDQTYTFIVIKEYKKQSKSLNS